jgi:hypothetical protein
MSLLILKLLDNLVEKFLSKAMKEMRRRTDSNFSIHKMNIDEPTGSEQFRRWQKSFTEIRCYMEWVIGEEDALTRWVFSLGSLV